MINLKQRIKVIKTNIGYIENKSKSFAQSLVKQYEQRGSLSEKQRYYVDKFYKSIPKRERLKAIVPKSVKSISSICLRCGLIKGRRQKERMGWEEGKCDVCSKDIKVTHASNWGLTESKVF